MPTAAETHIQNSTPGPPSAIARVTPAMLPVPTVPPRAVARAWKGATPPPEPPRAKRRSVPMSHAPGRRSCTAPEQQVIYRPAPTKTARAAGPQSSPERASRISKRAPPSRKYMREATQILTRGPAWIILTLWITNSNK